MQSIPIPLAMHNPLMQPPPANAASAQLFAETYMADRSQFSNLTPEQLVHQSWRSGSAGKLFLLLAILQNSLPFFQFLCEAGIAVDQSNIDDLCCLTLTWQRFGITQYLLEQYPNAISTIPLSNVLQYSLRSDDITLIDTMFELNPRLSKIINTKCINQTSMVSEQPQQQYPIQFAIINHCPHALKYLVEHQNVSLLPVYEENDAWQCASASAQLQRHEFSGGMEEPSPDTTQVDKFHSTPHDLDDEKDPFSTSTTTLTMTTQTPLRSTKSPLQSISNCSSRSNPCHGGSSSQLSQIPPQIESFIEGAFLSLPSHEHTTVEWVWVFVRSLFQSTISNETWDQFLLRMLLPKAISSMNHVAARFIVNILSNKDLIQSNHPSFETILETFHFLDKRRFGSNEVSETLTFLLSIPQCKDIIKKNSTPLLVDALNIWSLGYAKAMVDLGGEIENCWGMIHSSSGGNSSLYPSSFQSLQDPFPTPRNNLNEDSPFSPPRQCSLNSIMNLKTDKHMGLLTTPKEHRKAVDKGSEFFDWILSQPGTASQLHQPAPFIRHTFVQSFLLNVTPIVAAILQGVFIPKCSPTTDSMIYSLIVKYNVDYNQTASFDYPHALAPHHPTKAFVRDKSAYTWAISSTSRLGLCHIAVIAKYWAVIEELAGAVVEKLFIEQMKEAVG